MTISKCNTMTSQKNQRNDFKFSKSLKYKFYNLTYFKFIDLQLLIFKIIDFCKFNYSHPPSGFGICGFSFDFDSLDLPAFLRYFR